MAGLGLAEQPRDEEGLENSGCSPGSSSNLFFVGAPNAGKGALEELQCGDAEGKPWPRESSGARESRQHGLSNLLFPFANTARPKD